MFKVNMTQYVLEIRDDGWLECSFTVTEESPVPETPPTGCTQVVMTNTDSYNAIVAAYDQYTTQLIFSYDEPGEKIDCAGAITDSWPIN